MSYDDGGRYASGECTSKALEAAHKELHALRLSVSGTREPKDATQDPPAVDGERSANARVPSSISQPTPSFQRINASEFRIEAIPQREDQEIK